MNIIIYANRKVEKQYTEKEGSQNENGVSELEFTLPEEYSELTPKVVFITRDDVISKNITNSRYVIESDITQYEKLKAYVCLMSTETTEDFRSEVFDIAFNYNENAEEEIPAETEV